MKWRTFISVTVVAPVLTGVGVAAATFTASPAAAASRDEFCYFTTLFLRDYNFGFLDNVNGGSRDGLVSRADLERALNDGGEGGQIARYYLQNDLNSWPYIGGTDGMASREDAVRALREQC